jgi:hypothetical protein
VRPELRDEQQEAKRETNDKRSEVKVVKLDVHGGREIYAKAAGKAKGRFVWDPARSAGFSPHHRRPSFDPDTLQNPHRERTENREPRS